MITPELYENIALYLDKGTFVSFLTIKNVDFSFNFWVNKFKYDDLPFFMSVLPMKKKEWIQEYIKLHIARTVALDRIKRYKKYVPFFGRNKIQYIYIIYDPKINRSEGVQIKTFCGELQPDMISTLTLALHCPDTLHILMLFYLKAPNTYHLYENPKTQLFLHKQHGYYLPDIL